jgi:hypothetical protein
LDGDGYRCECLDGFGSDNCSTDYCATLDCKNGGTCVRLPGSAKCECPQYYSGTECEIFTPPWESVGSNTIEGAKNIDIAMNGDTPCFVYRDIPTGNGLTVRCLNNDEWLPVGSEGFSYAGSISGLQIQYWDGTPYVTNRSSSGIYQIEQMYAFDGIDWYSTSFNDQTAFEDVFTSDDLAICDGVVYTAFSQASDEYVVSSENNWTVLGTYQDGAGQRLECDGATLYRVLTAPDWTDSDRAQIQVWDSALEQWNFIADQDFYIVRDLETIAIDIAVYNGVPYVAIAEGQVGVNTRISVMKLGTTAWEFVGESQFTTAYWFTTLKMVVNDEGKPIVAFTSEDDERPAIVQFDGETWRELGDRTTLLSGIGSVFDYSITLADDGTVWMAMTDDDNYRRITVKKISSL